MFQALLAVFWVALGVFFLLAPDHIFRSSTPTLRRIVAAIAFIFAAASVVALIAAT